MMNDLASVSVTVSPFLLVPKRQGGGGQRDVHKLKREITVLNLSLSSSRCLAVCAAVAWIHPVMRYSPMLRMFTVVIKVHVTCLWNVLPLCFRGAIQFANSRAWSHSLIKLLSVQKGKKKKTEALYKTKTIILHPLYRRSWIFAVFLQSLFN